MRLPTRLTALAAFSALSSFPIPQPTIPDFRPFEFLVGDCWVGAFPDGKQTDEHCFSWLYDGKALRDVHTVRAPNRPDYPSDGASEAWAEMQGKDGWSTMFRMNLKRVAK